VNDLSKAIVHAGPNERCIFLSNIVSINNVRKPWMNAHDSLRGLTASDFSNRFQVLARFQSSNFSGSVVPCCGLR